MLQNFRTNIKIHKILSKSNNNAGQKYPCFKQLKVISYNVRTYVNCTYLQRNMDHCHSKIALTYYVIRILLICNPTAHPVNIKTLYYIFFERSKETKHSARGRETSINAL